MVCDCSASSSGGGYNSDMDRPSRIILTGFSGTGKSTVAALLAAVLDWECLDTDTLVEHMADKPIADIFREEGEERFRDLESDALREVCVRENVVVSVGGGAVLRPENRRIMAQGGFVVCLDARPETILQRLRSDEGSEPLERPLLSSSDPLSRIRELKESRQPLYTLSDGTVHTDELTPAEVADQIVRAYEGL